MLPTFIVIGSQKAGTSSIYHILRQHPDIYMSPLKEINFFTNDKRFKQGKEYYEKFFQYASSGEKAYGEATPGYICNQDVPARIYKYLPDIKLILTLRNPIERAYSQYWHNRRVLSETRLFKDVIDLALTDSYKSGQVGYFSRGIYMKFILNYLEYFHRNQLLILLFDDLCNNPSMFYNDIFSFLNVKPSFQCPEMIKMYNKSFIWENFFYKFFYYNRSYQEYLKYIPKKMKNILFFGEKKEFLYPPIDAKSKTKLIKFYEPWNKELSVFLGRDLTQWNE